MPCRAAKSGGRDYARLGGQISAPAACDGWGCGVYGAVVPLLRFPLDFDYVHVSRYGDKLAGGAFNWKRMPDPEQIRGRHVVVLDDILDEGHTMSAIQSKLLEMGAASCRAAVFANKLIDKEKPTKADYVGLDVPNRYVFGYGMDAAGCWRNLGEIYALNQG